MGYAAHGRLERVDFREHDREIERLQQLAQTPHHEDVSRTAVFLRRRGQLLEPFPKQPGAVLVAAADEGIFANLAHSNNRFSTKVSSWISR